MENIEEIIEIDQVRKHFVTCNKEWIIRHMKEFLNADNFYDNDDYLLGIYKTLKEQEKLEWKENKRNQMKEKLKEEQENIKEKRRKH